MITIETLKELKEKSTNKVAELEQNIWQIENQIQFEKAKIAVCDEMIAKEESANEQPNFLDNEAQGVGYDG